jgi:hypothetical protein
VNAEVSVAKNLLVLRAELDISLAYLLVASPGRLQQLAEQYMSLLPEVLLHHHQQEMQTLTGWCCSVRS